MDALSMEPNSLSSTIMFSIVYRVIHS